MAHDLRQLPGNSTVDVFDDVKVGRKEDIKVSLVDLVLSAAILPMQVKGRKANSQKV